MKALDKEIAAKYDTPARHTYPTLSATVRVVDVDPLTKRVVFGPDGRAKFKVVGKFAQNAAEAEKWDLRLGALIEKYESPEWVAAAMERQANVYDTLRTGLANATPALFDPVEVQQLATMRASGNPDLIVFAARIEASKVEFWEKKKKLELDAADFVVVRRYATMVAQARAKGIRNERVARALRRLALLHGPHRRRHHGHDRHRDPQSEQSRRHEAYLSKAPVRPVSAVSSRPHRSWAARSDSLEEQARIEAAQIVDIARHDDGALTAGDEDHGRVDHVGGSGAPTEYPRGFGEDLIERRNDGRGPFHESAQRRLLWSASPDLAEHARGDDQTHARLQRLANERAHPGITALERDEGTGV
jgi:hypothetical protein